MTDSSPSETPDMTRRGIKRVPALAWLTVIVSALLLIAGPANTAAAQSAKAVEWARFDVTIAVQSNGAFHVSERQEVDFKGGPFRNGFAVIPLSRIDNIGNLKVSEDAGGALTPLTFVSASAYDGDPGTYTYELTSTEARIDYAFTPTTNQTRTFVLEYDVVGALRVYPNETPPNQQIRWMAVSKDVTDVAPVRESTVTMVLPSVVDLSQVVVGGDVQGAASEYSTDGKTFTFTRQNLEGGDQFEVGLQFPPVASASPPSWQARYDQQQAARDKQEDRSVLFNLIFLGGGILLAIVGGLSTYGIWYARGRDPHTGLVADFLPTPPDDLSPGEAGALLDEQVDKRDVIATLLDLGHRGAIKIEETESKGILGFGSAPDFTLTLVSSAAATRDLEKDLLKTLFGQDLKDGASTKMSEVKDRFDAYQDDLADDLYGALVTRKLFLASPEATRRRWRRIGRTLLFASIIAGVALLIAFAGDAILVLIPIAVLIVIAIAFLAIGRAMPRKTQLGAETAAKWAAFRRYLDDIEKYEKVQESKEIFDKYLPYAVAFGLEESWVGKFSRVQAPTPPWFQGSLPGGGFGGEVIPSGRRRRYGRGGTVWVDPTYWGNDPRRQQRDSGDGGGIDLPDIDMPDLQDASDATGRSLQKSSDSLMGMLNVAASIFGAAISSGGGGGHHRGGGFGGFSGGGRHGGSSGGGRRGFG